jgi:predicted CXXCH cytochrome family protein
LKSEGVMKACFLQIDGNIVIAKIKRAIPSLPLAPVLFLSLLLLPPTTASSREIIFPPDGSLVDGESLDILGYRPKSAGTLSVSSGGEEKKSKVGPGQFSVSVTVNYGFTTISLGDETVKIFYPEGGIPEAAASFQKPDLHAVDNSCDDCHSEEGGTLVLSAEGAELCLNCHEDLTKDEDGEALAAQHPPAEEGECLECHVFHDASVKTLSAEGKMELCFGCHDDFREGEGLSMHSPVEEGECIECHLPHGSSESSLLTSPPEEVCMQCHDNPGLDDGGDEWSVAHPALDDGCTTCHNPHVAGEGSLLKSSTAALCAECHEEKNADGEGNAWETPHPPVEEGDCADCHLPHGSGVSSLLIQDMSGLCSECHDDKNADDDGNAWETPHPPVEEGACADCHLPHGSKVGALLSLTVPALCDECHDRMTLDEEGFEWETSHPPVQEGSCMDCHQPHGSAQTGLLESSIVDLCNGCHEDPHDVHLVYERPEEEGEGSVVPPDDFPMTKDGVFFCSGCHLPHGSANPSLWPGSMSDLCPRCHRM